MICPVHLSCASFNRVCTLCIFAFFRTSVSGILSCHLIFRSFLRQLRWKWLSFLAWRWYAVQVSHAYKRVGSTTALKTFSLVSSLIPFRSKTFVRSLPNATLAFAVLAVTSSSMCTALERVIGEFINNLKFLSIHSDGWFAVRLFRCWLVYYLSLFCANCELKVVTCF